ncbi:hypothetical protein [uncultured Rikenella sp.]|uniref:hypothetical protein n=1 Tax=uncultured Rikenella sp. TaxID=368003 RepID=UPI0026330E68|nr:hypothetical protein [uncultured Rikenella sp.]
MNGTFPYYSDGVVGESYGSGDYKATNGRLYKVTDDGTAGTPLAWYPAPGNRASDTGILWGFGNHGYSWSSTCNRSVGVFLNFGTQYLNSSAANGRAYGFQLRCLSEETGRDSKYEPVENTKSGGATVTTVAPPLLLYLGAV